MEHFGLSFDERRVQLEISRDKYAMIDNKNHFYPNRCFTKNSYTDESVRTYTNEWCEKYQQLILKNFDLNMRFFSILQHEEFEADLHSFLEKNNEFVEVFDLKEYYGVSGYYVMVLDKYCQVYVGTSKNIAKRIGEHWVNRKEFDKLLYPTGVLGVERSKLSIDSFGPLDTTRIFVTKTSDIYKRENEYIQDFYPNHVLNRMAGGKFPNGLSGFFEGVAARKTRDLL